jgi:hypothetical protein
MKRKITQVTVVVLVVIVTTFSLDGGNWSSSLSNGFRNFCDGNGSNLVFDPLNQRALFCFLD